MSWFEVEKRVVDWWHNVGERERYDWGRWAYEGGRMGWKHWKEEKKSLGECALLLFCLVWFGAAVTEEAPDRQAMAWATPNSPYS